jgi:hypothetical protein
MSKQNFRGGQWSSWTLGILAAAIIWIAFAAILLVIPRGQVAPRITMANTIVAVAPSKQVVLPNEDFTVDITIVPAAGTKVAGWQFDLKFNPLALKVNAAVEGGFLKQGGNKTFFMAPTVDNTAGLVKGAVGVSLGAGSNVTSPGIAATLQCTALASGKTSAFALDKVIVGDINAVALPLDLTTVGQVAVTYSADLNSDGIVDAKDLAILVPLLWTTGTPGWRREDLNSDGVIDVLDLIICAQEMSP